MALMMRRMGWMKARRGEADWDGTYVLMWCGSLGGLVSVEKMFEWKLPHLSQYVYGTGGDGGVRG